jgi:hypothetical protein
MLRRIRKLGFLACAISLIGFSGWAYAQATDVQCDQCVDASDIATGSIKNNKIQQFAVQSDKIAKQAVTSPKIAPGAVGTGKIADGAVTAEKLGGGLPAEIRQSGYDLEFLWVSTTEMEFDFASTSDASGNNGPLTLTEGASVLVIASSQVYKDPNDTSTDTVVGGYEPCYLDLSLTPDDPLYLRTTCVGSGSIGECYAGLTPICMNSNGVDDQRSVATSFLFKNMPAGTYQFGVCAAKTNEGGCSTLDGANFYLIGTKVTVIRTN